MHNCKRRQNRGQKGAASSGWDGAHAYSHMEIGLPVTREGIKEPTCQFLPFSAKKTEFIHLYLEGSAFFG